MTSEISHDIRDQRSSDCANDDERAAIDEAELDRLLQDLRGCTVCAGNLPLGARPVVRGQASARLLIISQAPGTRVHRTGLSFNDRSGDVLRQWLGISRDIFYDESRISIMPMGFCYPGRDSSGGDLPPRKECAPLWHARLRRLLPRIELTLLVGSYAIDYYLKGRIKPSMRDTVRSWRQYLPEFFPLPHPSWRNIAWIRNNPWFEAETLPGLRARLHILLDRA